MAGTRTVYRGSRGRFAGASAGKGEQVRVGRRSLAGAAAPVGPKASSAAKPSAQKQKVSRVQKSVNVRKRAFNEAKAGATYAIKSKGVQRVALIAVVGAATRKSQNLRIAAEVARGGKGIARNVSFATQKSSRV